jgi:hypothetical protein
MKTRYGKGEEERRWFGKEIMTGGWWKCHCGRV